MFFWETRSLLTWWQEVCLCSLHVLPVYIEFIKNCRLVPLQIPVPIYWRRWLLHRIVHHFLVRKDRNTDCFIYFCTQDDEISLNGKYKFKIKIKTFSCTVAQNSKWTLLEYLEFNVYEASGLQWCEQKLEPGALQQGIEEPPRQNKSHEASLSVHAV